MKKFVKRALIIIRQQYLKLTLKNKLEVNVPRTIGILRDDRKSCQMARHRASSTTTDFIDEVAQRFQQDARGNLLFIMNLFDESQVPCALVINIPVYIFYVGL